MSRYRGPRLRIQRRLGLLPGLTKKPSNNIRPGQHGRINNETNKKVTEYGLRLEEKQKLRFNYGLTENHLINYIREARRRRGITGLILLQLLEMRLDTICYNLGFASTINQARQIVNHGHIMINDKVVNIPSFQCKINDIISVNRKSKNLIKSNLKNNNNSNLPSHLRFSKSRLRGIILDYCDRDDISLDIKELLVIEYYSRR